jgi:VIT1/CCC1 family predicted Fe2+/Mn2+ transporter
VFNSASALRDANHPRMSTPSDTHLAAHTPEAIRARLEGGPSFSYLRDFIYGGIDGAVTTFAVVAGSQGAGLSPGVVVILGCANLFGDGLSMAAGNFLGTRAEQQQVEKARAQEHQHIDLHPEGEREEIRQIYAAKGLTGESLDCVVEAVTNERHRWVDTMLREEHGLQPHARSAARAAAMTLIAFLVVGALPLLPYFLDLAMAGRAPADFAASAALTGLAFFAVGAAKSRFVEQKWYWAGMETLGVGGAAALVAYLVGVALKGLAG